MTRGRSATRFGRCATALCVVGCLVAWLAGCVNVPTGGRVVSGRAAQNAGPVDDPYVRLIPVPPGQNWLPTQIVEGFITASAAFDDGHAVAKMYLAPDVDWEPDPRPSITVYEGSLGVTQTVATNSAGDRGNGGGGNGVRVQVTARQLGTISTDGQYQAISGKVNDAFQLGKDAHGQWRITGLPEALRSGMLLGQRDVDRAFRTLNLYFFGPDGTVLVPDPVFLPLINRRDLPGQLVRAVLSGPTSWLSSAVRTEFPRGTTLLGDRVDVTDGVATVNLSRQAAKGSPSGMSAQLMWTLRQLPEVNRMRLQIDGETISPPGVGALQSPGDWRINDADVLQPRPGGQPFYLRDGAGQVQQFNRRVEPVGRPGTVHLWHPAISLDERYVAGLSSDRDAVLVSNPAGATPRRVLAAPDSGGRFITPSWDRRGALWMVENHRGGSRLWVKEPDKKPVEVPAWDLGTQTVLALRVARDGVRIAAIVKAGRDEQLRIGRVVRGPAGRVTNVSDFLPISSEIVDAQDLAWRDADDLVVLGSTARQPQVMPYQVPVNGGTIRQIGNGVGDMISITALPHAPLLVGMLVTEKGKRVAKICGQSDERDPISGWKCIVEGHDPAYPG